MGSFTPPPNVIEYFWKLLMTGAFILGTALAAKYLGSTATQLPPPPTVMVQPVIVSAGADGTMRIMNVESPVKK